MLLSRGGWRVGVEWERILDARHADGHPAPSGDAYLAPELEPAPREAATAAARLAFAALLPASSFFTADECASLDLARAHTLPPVCMARAHPWMMHMFA